MIEDNLTRLIRLAEETFHAKEDPGQLNVDLEVMKMLRRLHPASMQERTSEAGPIAWAIVIPTMGRITDAFLSGSIGEQELLERTPQDGPFDAAYLCSALVLPEHRRHGLAMDMLVSAIRTMAAGHPITTLFAWPFSAEGELLAKAVAKRTGIALFLR